MTGLNTYQSKVKYRAVGYQRKEAASSNI